MTQTAHPAYRPDIDGLRAVAVASVLAYHYRVPGFGGGFTGVDVFFVISGFLITGLVMADIGATRVSLLAFYVRRVRRIFPALFAMLIVVTGAASVLLLPQDLKAYGQTLLASAGFATNVALLHQAGYFGPAAIARPLLHLWSIAVEEQFYLVFPAALIVISRVRRGPLALALALFAASLAYSIWTVSHAPDVGFYLLSARTWELMLGAVLAIAKPQMPWRGVRELLAAAGLLMTLYAIFVFEPGMAFPGAAALIPCGGAGLLLLAGRDGATVNRLLALAPLRVIGLISYSLYLWHWPVYALASYTNGRPLSIIETLACTALAITLAVASYYGIEQPLRRGTAPPWKPLALGAATLAATACAAGVLLATDGLLLRYPPAVQRLYAAGWDVDGRHGRCFDLPLAQVEAGALCRLGAGEAVTPSFILWGDSHADALRPALQDVAARAGREGYFAGKGSCAPILGLERADIPGCVAFNAAVLAFVRAHPAIKTVVLEARWGKIASGEAFGDEGHGFIPIGEGAGGKAHGYTHAPKENAAVFARAMRRTVETLRGLGLDVVLLGPVPEIGWAVPEVLAARALDGAPPLGGPSLRAFQTRQAGVLPLFADLAHEGQVRLVLPSDRLCRGGVCAAEANGVPLYRDEHHLTASAARALEPLLAHLFETVPHS